MTSLGKRVVRAVFGLVGVVVVLLAAGWIAFVPSAQGPDYEFVRAWGEKGSAPGQFNDPTGIAVAGNEVFVADARNNRIQVFDLDGHFKRMIGSKDDGPGALERPMNLTVHDGELYVPDYFSDRVQVFGIDGTPRRTIGAAGSDPGRFSAPGGVAVRPNGNLVVADFYNHRVQELTQAGDFVRQWGTTGKIGVGGGRFNYPTDVAIAPDGTAFVADGYNDRVQAFGPDGTLQAKWGGPFAINVFGPFNGWFATVTGVAVGPDGNVFVADFYNDRVQIFAPDGAFLTAFGTRGSGAGEFRHAMAVDVAEDGTVFVVDFGNARVQQWRRATR